MALSNFPSVRQLLTSASNVRSVMTSLGAVNVNSPHKDAFDQKVVVSRILWRQQPMPTVQLLSKPYQAIIRYHFKQFQCVCVCITIYGRSADVTQDPSKIELSMSYYNSCGHDWLSLWHQMKCIKTPENSQNSPSKKTENKTLFTSWTLVCNLISRAEPLQRTTFILKFTGARCLFAQPSPHPYLRKTTVSMKKFSVNALFQIGVSWQR